MSVRQGLDWEAAKARLERARLVIESTGYNSDQIETLYRERARTLARPEAGPDDGGEKIVVFRLGSARYAFPLANLAEVVVKPRIALAPGAPAEVVGVIQIRGEIRAVWNSARLLGVPETIADELKNVLLLKVADGSTVSEAGLLVGEVEDILAIKDEARRPPPDKAPHAAWMTSDLVVVLDPASMFPGRTERNLQE